MNEKNLRLVEPNVPTTSGATPNYGLPQWQGSDITDWFELNPAFAKIDEAMKSNETAAVTAQKTADSNTASVGNLTQSVNQNIQDIVGLKAKDTQIEQQVTLNTTHLNEHDTAIQTNTQAIAALQGESGDQSGEIAALQADVTELQGKMTTAQRDIVLNTDNIGNMSELETTEKTNLVGAINEIIGGSGSGDGATLADIGNLQELTTSDKSNLVAALNEVNNKSAGGIHLYYFVVTNGNITAHQPTLSISTLQTNTSSFAYAHLWSLSGFQDSGNVDVIIANMVYNMVVSRSLQGGTDRQNITLPVTRGNNGYLFVNSSEGVVTIHSNNTRFENVTQEIQGSGLIVSGYELPDSRNILGATCKLTKLF